MFRILCSGGDLPRPSWFVYDDQVQEWSSRATADSVASDWRFHFPDVTYRVVGEPARGWDEILKEARCAS